MFGNKVLAGYLEGESVRTGNGLVLIGSEAVAKWTVESYEVVSEEKNISLASVTGSPQPVMSLKENRSASPLALSSP